MSEDVAVRSATALPQDEQAERAVLSCALQDPNMALQLLDTLAPADFYQPRHSLIWQAMRDLAASNAPIEIVSVNSKLEGSGPSAPDFLFLAELARTPVAASSGPYYATTVQDRALARQALSHAQELQRRALDGQPAAAIQDFMSEGALAMGSRTGSVLEQAGNAAWAALDAIEEASKGDGSPQGIESGYIDLDRVLMGMRPGQMCTFAARPGVGKALSLDTPLPTPSGWTTMGQVQPGDWLLDAQGKPTRVSFATEVQHGRECFEVEFSDGSVIVADAEHLWETEDRAARRSRRALAGRQAAYSKQPVLPAVRTTRELLATLRITADQRVNHSVPTVAPLDLPERDLSLSPYALGLWLGDGASRWATVYSGDPEIVELLATEGVTAKRVPSASFAYSLHLRESAPWAKRECAVCGAYFEPERGQVLTCGKTCGGRLTVAQRATAPRCERCCAVITTKVDHHGVCASCHRSNGTVTGALTGLGVISNKHIPQAYLRSSVAQRRALLAGLLDSDGTVGKNGVIELAVTDRRLADDAFELIVSLGYRCHRGKKTVRGRDEAHSTAYRLRFTTADQVFRLPRKAQLLAERSRPSDGERTSLRYITDIRPTASVPVRCIQVENDRRLYLAGRAMIPTHNTIVGVDVARHVALRQDKPAVIFSLEMSQAELMQRILAAEARVGLNEIRSGKVSDRDWNRLGQATSDLTTAPLYIDDTPGISIPEMRNKCRRLAQRVGPLGIVVLDYIQLVQPADTGRRVEQSRQQEVATFSRGLKMMAKELGTPVLVLAQLNRDSEKRPDKKPQLSDLRESGAIEQDSDIVTLIHRPEMYDPDDHPGEVELIVSKNRNGERSLVRLTAVLSQSHFSNAALGGPAII